MIELTERQCQDLNMPEPIAINPKTQETYVLVRGDRYSRLKSLLSLDDFDPDEGARYINEVMADDDARDSYLESYQNYRKPA